MQNSPKCSFSAQGLMSSQGPMYWTHLSFSRSGSRVKRPWQWLHKPPPTSLLLRFSTFRLFLKIKLEIRHLHISNNTPCLSPPRPPPLPKKNWTTFVFSFLLGITAVPRQILMQHLGELTRCIMGEVQMANRKILTCKFPFPVPRSPPLLLHHPIGVRSLGRCSSSRTRPGTRLWRIIRQC